MVQQRSQGEAVVAPDGLGQRLGLPLGHLVAWGTCSSQTHLSSAGQLQRVAIQHASYQ